MAKSKASYEFSVFTSKFSQTKFNLSLLLFCAAVIAFFWPIVAEIFLGIYVSTASAEPIMYFAIFLACISIFLFFTASKSGYFCPKCDSNCSRELMDSQTDDITPKTKSGNRDMRFSTKMRTTENYEYTCPSESCGYVFSNDEHTFW